MTLCLSTGKLNVVCGKALYIGVKVRMHIALSVFVFYGTAYTLSGKETGSVREQLQNLFSLNDCPSDSGEIMIYLKL